MRLHLTHLLIVFSLFLLIAGICACATTGPSANDAPSADLIVINDDGGWCWFEGERAIIHNGWLLVGSVAAGHADRSRRGDIEITTRHLISGEQHRITLHDDFELDDHNSPALLPLADGSVLAAWSKHGPESCFYVARSDPADLAEWGQPRSVTPSESSRITYSNLFRLRSEDDRIYNFFRGLDNSWKPSFAYSDDGGANWTTGNVVINVPTDTRHRPYVRYADDGGSQIHLLYTEGHPRDFDNSAYHIVYETGALHHSNGKRIAGVEDGIARPADGTLVFKGNADQVAWVMDVRLDATGNPVALLSVQQSSAGLPKGMGGDDHRYYYARWNNGAWQAREIAFAGTRLYAGEDDYTGLGSIDPNDVDAVYISTNADPVTGEPLISNADGMRHWEIYRGDTRDGGASWSWTAVTEDSTADNLRPIVVPGDIDSHIVLWLRGVYRSYIDYNQQVVALISRR